MKGSVPRIGNERNFNATAFSLKPGELSKMIETRRGLYWIMLIEKTEPDSSVYTEQAKKIQDRLLAQKKNQAFTSWYDYLKSSADIKDNRKMFNL